MHALAKWVIFFFVFSLAPFLGVEGQVAAAPGASVSKETVKAKKTASKRSTAKKHQVSNKKSAKKSRSLKKTSAKKRSHSKKQARYTPAQRKMARATMARLKRSVARQENGVLSLGSSVGIVVNQQSGDILYAKNPDVQAPIASLTKVMTAMVVLDTGVDMDEIITITTEDVDTLRRSSSHLPIGVSLPRHEMLRLALMSSENRAAHALGRTTLPGGLSAFIYAMNSKADELGMTRSQFRDPTGLHGGNISTARDLVKMVAAAYEYPTIRAYSTAPSYDLEYPNSGLRRTSFRNTNALVRSPTWEIGLSKTGYLHEAGRCLLMQARIADQPLIIILLDGNGRYTRIGDANRIRRWMESSISRADHLS